MKIMVTNDETIKADRIVELLKNLPEELQEQIYYIIVGISLKNKTIKTG